jgi:hypothetical protein
LSVTAPLGAKREPPGLGVSLDVSIMRKGEVR